MSTHQRWPPLIPRPAHCYTIAEVCAHGPLQQTSLGKYLPWELKDLDSCWHDTNKNPWCKARFDGMEGEMVKFTPLLQTAYWKGRVEGPWNDGDLKVNVDSEQLTQPMDPEKKSLNFIFPTKYVFPKSLKFSHWLSKTMMCIWAVATASEVYSVIFGAFWNSKSPLFTLTPHLNPYPLSYAHNMGKHLQKEQKRCLIAPVLPSLCLLGWGLELCAIIHQYDPSVMFPHAACEVHLGLLFLETTRIISNQHQVISVSVFRITF